VLEITSLASAAIYIEDARSGGSVMKKLAPTRQFFDRAKGHITVRAQLPELSDWSLKDIGIFRQVPGLDAVKPFWMA
jgi:hypothetical protein